MGNKGLCLHFPWFSFWSSVLSETSSPLISCRPPSGPPMCPSPSPPCPALDPAAWPFLGGSSSGLAGALLVFLPAPLSSVAAAPGSGQMAAALSAHATRGHQQQTPVLGSSAQFPDQLLRGGRASCLRGHGSVVTQCPSGIALGRSGFSLGPRGRWWGSRFAMVGRGEEGGRFPRVLPAFPSPEFTPC